MSIHCDDQTARPKLRLYVSYHHDNDRPFYEAFCHLFASRFEIIDDASVERTTGSDDGEGIVQMLGARFISRADHTVVLCGMRTPWRKFVDWEIKAALEAGHGLIGINLPTNPSGANGLYIVPDRLYDNLRSGYAALLQWHHLKQEPERLAQQLQQAALPVDLIRNSRPLLRKGG